MTDNVVDMAAVRDEIKRLRAQIPDQSAGRAREGMHPADAALAIARWRRVVYLSHLEVGFTQEQALMLCIKL